MSFRHNIDKSLIEKFIKANLHLDIVKEMKEANQNRNIAVFNRCLHKIENHLHAVEVIDESIDYWNACKCADCNLWKEQYEEMLIASAID
jgi:hypothetical protein